MGTLGFEPRPKAVFGKILLSPFAQPSATGGPNPAGLDYVPIAQKKRTGFIKVAVILRTLHSPVSQTGDHR